MKAYILAGGESRRMGQNKALLDINGSSLIEVIAEQLSDFEEVVIVGNKETYNHLNYRVIEDIIPSKGPLSGIHTALKDADDNCFICSCDSPSISEEMFIEMPCQFEINGEVQRLPFVADLFDTPLIEDQLNGEDFSLKTYFENSPKPLIPIDYSLYWNLNTPEKLEEYLESIS